MYLYYIIDSYKVESQKVESFGIRITEFNPHAIDKYGY